MARIQLISGPRNISTALMYSFGNRGDCAIIDEPLYAYYLNNTTVHHPDKELIIRSMSTDPKKILTGLVSDPLKTDHLFIKNMAHHFMGINDSAILPFKNVFLIRDTKQILTSFSKVIKEPTMEDIGIKKEWDLFNYLLQKGINPLVVNSGLLLKDPLSVLTQLCLGLDIKMDDDMLKWEAGPRTEDGIWARHWYKNVHLTTGFNKQKSSNDPLPKNLFSVYEQSNYFYQKLLAHAIRP